LRINSPIATTSLSIPLVGLTHALIGLAHVLAGLSDLLVRSVHTPADFAKLFGNAIKPATRFGGQIGNYLLKRNLTFG
jgi:hypothetical protein